MARIFHTQTILHDPDNGAAALRDPEGLDAPYELDDSCEYVEKLEPWQQEWRCRLHREDAA